MKGDPPHLAPQVLPRGKNLQALISFTLKKRCGI
jgi:hypothetical protein